RTHRSAFTASLLGALPICLPEVTPWGGLPRMPAPSLYPENVVTQKTLAAPQTRKEQKTRSVKRSRSGRAFADRRLPAFLLMTPAGILLTAVTLIPLVV